MSAGMYQLDNMIYRAGNLPWHGMGIPFSGKILSMEALEKASAAFKTLMADIYLYRPLPVEVFSSLSEAQQALVTQLAVIQKQLAQSGLNLNIGQTQVIKTHKATLRSDLEWSDPLRVMGIVGEGYHPASNSTLTTLCDRIVGGAGAEYETLGTLDNGRKFYATAVAPDSLRVMDDELRLYVLVTGAHDGSGAIVVKLVTIRVVCQNTLAAALAESLYESVKIKHTPGNFDSRGEIKASVVNEARAGVVKRGVKTSAGIDHANPFRQSLTQTVNAQLMLFNRFAQSEVSAQFVKDYLECLVPDPLDASATRAQNKRTELLSVLYGTMPGDETGQKAIRVNRQDGSMSAYRLFNAVTYWSDHMSSNRRTKDKRTGEARSESEARFNRILSTGETTMREIATRLLIEGLDSAGRVYTEALRKHREAQAELLSRKAMLNKVQTASLSDSEKSADVTDIVNALDLT